MPIVESPQTGSSLSQGDILEGVLLFATKEGWLDSGGEAAKAPQKMCLVISRPCAIAHKSHVVVAGIEKYPDEVPRTIDTFEKALSFLTGARDGVRAPDIFYLGQLPNRQGRFCARFDSLFSVQVPSEPATLQEFLQKKRIASLHPDFARDLHGRLFNAFASLGFEDNAWPSDEDLNWLVSQGKADITKAEATAQEQRAKKASLAAEGKSFAEKELTAAETKLAELKAAVAPFETEQQRRQKPAT
ncbi:MAG TPA: hypothetical protein VFE62_03375 [Gemmataceae bacterium]|nr:hypothetical protein [Gemmataceae bacterium]